MKKYVSAGTLTAAAVDAAFSAEVQGAFSTYVSSLATSPETKDEAGVRFSTAIDLLTKAREFALSVGGKEASS